MFAGLGGRSEGEPLVAAAAVADPGEGQSANDESGFFGGVVFGLVCASPFAADGFERGAVSWEGKTIRETKRALKRSVTRQLFRLLEPPFNNR